MHFTIGGHPGFNVPVLPDTEYSDYALKFAEDQDELHFIHIDMNTGTGLPDKVYTCLLYTSLAIFLADNLHLNFVTDFDNFVRGFDMLVSPLRDVNKTG